jgi:hypothetical protein
MIGGQIAAAVKMFGGLKNTPKWLDITLGVLLLLVLAAVFELVE